ncbi:hypothetical protein OV203_44310 [Nannocystis sp. ILAH1]|uniref:hypothetical protein n=1 Tax=unclassified Nannocystis TaxID=2627009 RepID=UPI002271326C|nr:MULTISPECIES: hypothetical protein [unclassified Nannocystis]MCY0994236.1 hypothetical protein [Nannocystis sp. ILAH1]MCY1064017.1 hypothetical protein [Nannocystis sp. RBIL2]
MSRGASPVLFVLSLLFGLACAGRSGPARCPGDGWCGPAEVAERMAEVAAGATLTCPIHVESAYAKDPQGSTEGEAAADAGALPPGVPEGAHGTLDEKRTRQLRQDGDATSCCYTWVAPCPG